MIGVWSARIDFGAHVIVHLNVKEDSRLRGSGQGLILDTPFILEYSEI
jgi:hypothetical protein